MLAGRLCFIVLIAAASGALVYVSGRLDRALRWIVIGSLAINLTGAVAMGWWTQHVHGRAYTAGDEVSYQVEGAKILSSWRTGTSFVRSTVGIYAPINAVVIAIWGTGQTPMRMLTALIGSAGVVLAFQLALILFRNAITARIAAVLSATSPVIVLYSWANLRDRWIAVAALVVFCTFFALLKRWTLRQVTAVALTVLMLTELRHYWGALLGWLVIFGYPMFADISLRQRSMRTAALILVLGTALWIGSGTFLAISMRSESVTRYVTLTPDNASAIAEPNGPVAGEESSSGSTLGVAEPATAPSSISAFLDNVWFVLAGRVHARPDAGQFASVFLFPESLWAPVLFLVAAAGVLIAIAAGELAALVPAAYIGVMVAVLSWLRGDDWNTYRFRGLYWPVLLVFAAGGLTPLYYFARAQVRAQLGKTSA